jgi:hypothetical protein
MKRSSTAKFILNSFQNKYIYYAIDDILYLLKSDPIERDSLQQLYSPILSLQNNSPLTFLIFGSVRSILMKQQRLISFIMTLKVFSISII